MLKAQKSQDDQLARKLETEKLERLLQQVGAEEEERENEEEISREMM